MFGRAPSVESTAAAHLADAVENLPAWRSLEVFGPPGAGKSYLCREASVRLEALTMCDRQAVRFYAARDFPRTTVIAKAVLGRRRSRNYYSIRLNGYIRRYWKHAEAPREYLSAAERVRDELKLPMQIRRRFDNRVRGSGAMIARALADGRRILADEGLLNQLNSAIARSVGDRLDHTGRDLVRACLQAYPWEKTALIVEASPETCARRQEQRGHALFTPDRPQSVFHTVTDMLDQLCRETGWRTLRISND